MKTHNKDLYNKKLLGILLKKVNEIVNRKDFVRASYIFVNYTSKE